MKKKLLLAALAALATMALAGCSSGASTATDQDGTESVQKDVASLSLAYLNKAGYETVIVADKQGYFEEADPDIELLTVSGSGQQAVEALLAGSADIAATGQGPVADALGQYDDIVVLCGTNCSTDTQVWVASPSMTGEMALVAYDKEKDNKAEVAASFEQAATQLGGHVKLGVQQGATTESAVKSWLTAMGVTYNEFGVEGDGVVSLVDVKANTLPTVLANGADIDVMAASQPYPDTALSNIQGSYRIGSNADTNSYDASLFITTKEVYAEKEDSIKEFIGALKRATDYMADDANVGKCVTICADAMGASEDTVQAAFDTADWNTTMSDRMIESIQKAAKKKGYDTTIEDVRAACPLIDWLDNDLNK